MKMLIDDLIRNRTCTDADITYFNALPIIKEDYLIKIVDSQITDVRIKARKTFRKILNEK